MTAMERFGTSDSGLWIYGHALVTGAIVGLVMLFVVAIGHHDRSVILESVWLGILAGMATDVLSILLALWTASTGVEAPTLTPRP